MYDYVFDKAKCQWKPWMETVKVMIGLSSRFEVLPWFWSGVWLSRCLRLQGVTLTTRLGLAARCMCMPW